MSRAVVARALALFALAVVFVVRIDSRAGQPAKTASDFGAIPAAQTAVERALGEPADFEFKKSPLRDIAASIAERYKISVQLDMKGLADANVSGDTPITDSIKDVSLRSALHFILGDNELGWCEDRGGVLIITTPDIAKQHVITRAYGIESLYDSAEEFPATRGSAGEILDVVSSTIAPTTWTTNGNGSSGTLTFLAGALVVSQTDEIQLQVAELVAALKALHQRQQDKSKSEPMPPAILLGASSRDAHIEQMLDSKLDFDFNNTTLADIAEWLQVKLRIPVRLDKKAFKDAGLTSDVKLSVMLTNVSARAGLRGLLNPRDLGFTIDHEVLLITTADVAKTKTVIEIYPVGDLVKTADSDQMDFDSLIEAITSNVSPASWDSGPPPIAPFSGCAALVFSQTEEVHQQIKELLQMVRAANKENSPAPTVATDAPVIRFYSLSSYGSGGPVDEKGGRQIIDMICKLIEPKSWSKPEAYIGFVAGAIVVRQTLEVQRRIDRLLGPGGLGSAIRPTPTTVGPTNVGPTNARGPSGGFGGNVRH